VLAVQLTFVWRWPLLKTLELAVVSYACWTAGLVAVFTAAPCGWTVSTWPSSL
jgi:hypothetical protein